MDDALTDLDDRPGQAPGPDDPVSVALRRALDGDLRPGEAALLAGVQARATRSHRRRLGVAGAAVAASVAAVVLVVPAVGTGYLGPSRQRQPAPALAGPARPSAQAPGGTDGDGPEPALTAASFLTLHEVAAGLPGAGAMSGLPLHQEVAEEPQRTGVCDGSPPAGDPAPTELGAVSWSDGELAQGGPLSSQMTEELTRWDAPEAALQDAAAAAASAQACAAASAAAGAALGAGSTPSQQSGSSAPSGYHLVTPPAGLGAHAVVTVSSSFPHGWDVRVHAVDGTAGLTVSAVVVGGGAADADTTAARVADLAVTALHRATAPVTVTAPTPHMMTHGPDPRE